MIVDNTVNIVQNVNTDGNGKPVSLLYFNAQGITIKFPQLLALVDEENPDIICISETWCDSTVLDSEFSLPEYMLFRRDKTHY